MNKVNKRHGKNTEERPEGLNKELKAIQDYQVEEMVFPWEKYINSLSNAKCSALKTHVNGRLWRLRRLYMHVTFKGKVAMDLKENKEEFGGKKGKGEMM